MNIVERVADCLQKNGIPAEKAWPGKKAPEITGPCGEVYLEKMDFGEKTASVCAEILSPAAAGGPACEEAALQAARCLSEVGKVRIAGGCRFLSGPDCYDTKILVDFYRDEVFEEWALRAFLDVRLDDVKLDHLQSFSVWQDWEEIPGTDLKTEPWRFRIEEWIPAGDKEKLLTYAPFTMTVKRKMSRELYKECTWLEIHRKDTFEGIRQVRVGSAKSRIATAAV